MNKMLFVAAFCCATSIASAQEFRELQDNRHNVIGYIGPNAVVVNDHKEFIGQFKGEGMGKYTILDRNHQVIGHMTQSREGIFYENAKNEKIGSMDRQGVFHDANDQLLGSVKQDGAVEDKNHTVVGYEIHTEPMWAGPFYLLYKFK